MYASLKEKIVRHSLVRKFEGSMRLKFVGALTLIVTLLMAAGAVSVVRMLMDDEQRAIERRGKELGMFLGRAAADYIQNKDIIGIDTLASDVVKSSQDMIYTVILDQSGSVPLSTLVGSFSHENEDVRRLVAAEATADVVRTMNAVRRELQPIEVNVSILLEGARIGTVVMGFSRDGALRDVRRVIWLLAGLSIGIVATLSAVVNNMVRRMIATKTLEAERIASNIAAGDLTRSVRVSSTDELGQLGRELNRMIIGLKGMIGNVRMTSQGVGAVSAQVQGIAARLSDGSQVQAEAVEDAASSVNEMHFSLKEIASTVGDVHHMSEGTVSAAMETSASVAEVARTMTELSASIEDTASAITQMSAAIREIAEHVAALSAAADETAATAMEISASVREVEASAGKSSELADAVAADAQQLGMRSIEKSIAGMKQIEATVQRSAEVINRLGGRAENIGTILTVIEDITDQTGLLALNAAILAAQAGEHGKGFAVVATEIRELANRTAASTKEISGLISSVQEESRQAVEAMREGVAIVEQGVKLTDDAGHALRKILDRAIQSQDMSRSISRAAAEQTMGIRQVSDAVERITTMTHQIAAATSEQRTGSDQIMQATVRMREITNFVKTSTSEQAKGSREITQSVDQMTQKIALVNRAASEVQAGSELIVGAIERIKQIAKANAGLSGEMDRSIHELSSQAAALSAEIAKFKTTGGSGPSPARG